MSREYGVNIMEELKDLNKSKNVSELGSKEVSKKLRNFSLALMMGERICVRTEQSEFG